MLISCGKCLDKLFSHLLFLKIPLMNSMLIKYPRFYLAIFFLFICLNGSSAQERISRQEYIAMYSDDAIKEMYRSGIPASITLAQALLESADGNSTLARKANNHFGIKCHSSWRGKTFYQDDDKRDECFRSYDHPLESYRDHSEFLKRERYAFLFQYKTTDYKKWAKGLKKAGYATNPRYPELLIKIIEENHLDRFDEKIDVDDLEDLERLAVKPDKEAKEIKKDEKGKRKVSSYVSSGYKIYKHENNIKYIVPRAGESLEDIAQQFNMGVWQLYKYNDYEKGDEIKEGSILFLQPKRSKANVEYHVVQKGESLWDISQKFGVKLKKIYKRNDIQEGARARVGQKLELR